MMLLAHIKNQEGQADLDPQGLPFVPFPSERKCFVGVAYFDTLGCVYFRGSGVGFVGNGTPMTPSPHGRKTTMRTQECTASRAFGTARW